MAPVTEIPPGGIVAKISRNYLYNVTKEIL
jgi:hypothetical protein